MSDFNFLKFLSKYWIFIVVLMIVAGGSGYMVAKRKPATVTGSVLVSAQAISQYQGSSNLIIEQNPVVENQAAIAAIEGWVADPSFVATVLTKATNQSVTNDVKDLATKFSASVPASNSASLQIEYIGASKDDVTAVLTTLDDQIVQRATDYNAQTGSNLKMNVHPGTPYVADTVTSLKVIPLLGLLVGFVLAVAIAAIVDRKEA
jgi:hypothetical protein